MMRNLLALHVIRQTGEPDAAAKARDVGSVMNGKNLTKRYMRCCRQHLNLDLPFARRGRFVDFDKIDVDAFSLLQLPNLDRYAFADT